MWRMPKRCQTQTNSIAINAVRSTVFVSPAEAPVVAEVNSQPAFQLWSYLLV
jgi:hypothetical protein